MIFQRTVSVSFFSSFLFLSSAAFAQMPPAPVKAPFQTDAVAPAANGSKYMDLYDTERSEDIVPLDKPHRTSEQIASWVEDNVTTAMNIDPSKWDLQLKKITPEFDTFGFQEYNSYLKSSGLLDLLQTNHLRVNAIADGPSVLLSEGALSGSYHWLYQMPMMLTYYDQDIKSFKPGQARPQNRKVLIRVQIGRTAGAGNDDNHIVIEHWSVTNQ